MDLNQKVCLLPLVLGFRMKNIFNLSLVKKTCHLGDMVLLVLESAGGGDVLRL